MADLRQSEEYANYIKGLGWQVVKTSEGVNVFIKKLPIIGSLIKIQRPEKINLKEVDEIAKKNRAIFVKIEPEKEIELPGYRQDSWPLVPTKTVIIDLNDLRFDKEVRYCIRKADEKGLEIKESSDIYQLFKLLKYLDKNCVVNFYEAFKKRAKIILAIKESVVVSGALIIFHEKTCHFMYAGTNYEGRKLMAAYKVLWECIKISKKLGYKYLDLEGAHDERFPKLNKKWVGFTHFKMGWGGKSVYYPGSYINYRARLLKAIGK